MPPRHRRRILELVKENESPNGWVYVEKVNLPFLHQIGAKPERYGAGIKWLITEALINMHKSGAYFTLMEEAKAAPYRRISSVAMITSYCKSIYVNAMASHRSSGKARRLSCKPARPIEAAIIG